LISGKLGFAELIRVSLKRRGHGIMSEPFFFMNLPLSTVEQVMDDVMQQVR